MFSIFGAERVVRMIRAESVFKNTFEVSSRILSMLYFRNLQATKSFLLTLIFFAGFLNSGSAQCLKSNSTCNIASIRTAMTGAGCIELGCGSDSCSIYFLNPNAVSADSAENFAQGLGAHLASISNVVDNDSLVKWLLARGDTGAVWIGLNDIANEGKFVWTDGADTTFKNWATGKPNGISANDDYAHLWLTGVDSTKWNDTIGSINLLSIIRISTCMSIQMSQADTVCENDSSSFWTAASFGSLPYSYSWSNTSTTDTIKVAPSSSTTFIVTATDRYSCSIVDSVRMRVNPLPVFNMGGADTICADTSITLDAGAGGSYYWHSTSTIPSDTNRTYPIVVSGTYWCRKTDALGCSYTDTFKLTVDSLPTFYLGGAKTVCDGDTVTFNSPLTGPNYQLKWHDNSTANSFLADTNVHVKLTVTNSRGCSFTDSAQVTWAPLQSISLQNDTSLCSGNVIVVNGPSVGSVYDEWIIHNDTSKTFSVTVDTAGTYYYYGLDANNCPMRDTFTVIYDTVPIVNLGMDTSICQNDSIILDAGPGMKTYTWFGVRPGSPSTGQTIIADSNNTYFVFVTDSNDCNGDTSFTLSINALPTVDLRSNGHRGDTSICTLDSVYIHARVDSTYEYSWNGGAFSQFNDSVIAKTAGLYQVTIRDTNTCVNKDSLNLSLDTLPQVNLRTDTTICINDSILLKANYSAHYRYTWNNVNLGFQDSLWVKKDTAHWAKIVDTNTTCFNTDTMNLSHDTLPIINLGIDTAFCIGDSIRIDAGSNYAKYLWNTSDTTQILTIKTPSTYSVAVIDKNGCKGSDSRIVQMNILPSPNLGPDKEFCAGSPVNEVLDPGRGYAFYSWSGGPAGDSTAARRKTVMAQGTYSVTVTDFNKCKAADTILINANFLPTVNLGPDTSFCKGDRFNFIVDAGPGFVQYEWFESKFGAPLITLPSTGQILLIQDSSSNVIVKITDINGCQNQDTLRVIELLRPIVNFTTTRYCEVTAPIFSELIDADPAGAYTKYLWSTGDSTKEITATASGDYYVTVTGSNSCTTEGLKKIIEVPQPKIDFSADTLLCKGAAVKLEAFNDEYLDYWWYKVSTVAGISDSLMNPLLPPDDKFPDTTISNLTINAPGKYKVVTRYFQDPFCIDSNETAIREDIRPTIEFGIQAPDTTLCVGETLRLSPNFTGSSTETVLYKWQNGITDSVLLATSTGLYTLTLTNDCGTEINEVYVQFDDCSNIWIPNSFTPNGDFDNDQWGVSSLENFLEYRIQIFDNMGRIAWESNLPGVKWDGTHQYNGEPMPTGTYVFKLTYRSRFELIDDVNSAPTKELTGVIHLFR